MALSFGVTVLPDPPYTRLVELMALGERHGFEIGWTYDSHVLWQDSFPLLTLAVQATTTMKFGHLVTNPGTREPTVLASLYATLHDISNGRMVMGIGRGDSARRYIGQQPVRVAEFETACRMIKPFMNGEEVHWNDTDLQLKCGRRSRRGPPTRSCRRRSPVGRSASDHRSRPRDPLTETDPRTSLRPGRTHPANRRRSKDAATAKRSVQSCRSRRINPHPWPCPGSTSSGSPSGRPCASRRWASRTGRRGSPDHRDPGGRAAPVARPTHPSNGQQWPAP